YVRRALLTAGAQSPQNRPAHQDRARSQRDRLEHIAPPPDAAIDVDLAPIAGRLDDMGQDFTGGRRGIELASAMIRNNDSLRSVFRRPARIIAPANSLHHDWQPRAGA